MKTKEHLDEHLNFSFHYEISSKNMIINREVNAKNIHCIYLKLLFQDEINSDTYNLVSGIYAASSNHKLHILTTQLADCQNSE